MPTKHLQMSIGSANNFLPYTKFEYLWPPRTQNKTSPDRLARYEDGNWGAEFKKCGTNNSIYVSPKKQLIARGRKNNEHADWSFSPESGKLFQQVPGRDWWLFNAELLNNKVADDNLRDINYIFDVLVADGQYLIGSTYPQRRDLLLDVFKPGLRKAERTHSHWVLNDRTWLARSFDTDFVTLWEQAQEYPEDEGLMLKNKRCRLQYGAREKNNTDWLVRCRKPHMNYTN